MIPRIKDIQPLADYKLFVRFDEGQEVVYDVGEDISSIEAFEDLLRRQAERFSELTSQTMEGAAAH